MHVVHPYPTSANPSFSRYGVRPAWSRYSVTTRDPGARLVLTQGFVCSPASTAFFAKRPAATMTEGFDVFVQLVIAAMTTDPSRSSFGCSERRSANTDVNDDHTSGSATRSCGRFGPASDGTTASRSRSSTSVNTGSGSPSRRNRPCASE